MRLIKSGIFKVVVIIFCIFAISQLLFSINDLSHKKDIIKERLFVLEQEKKNNMDLKDKITKYHDNFWIEKQIRERLGLAKPGETVYMISKNNFETTKSGEIDTSPPLRKWWNLFFENKE